jgi:hypothetical protein
MHSANVLRDIFGLKEFKIIDAETKKPGSVVKFRTGYEKNCKYENFKNGLGFGYRYAWRHTNPTCHFELYW